MRMRTQPHRRRRPPPSRLSVSCLPSLHMPLLHEKVEFSFLFSISVITHQLGSTRRIISHSAHTEPRRRRLSFFPLPRIFPFVHTM